MKCPHCLENCYVQERTPWNVDLNRPGQTYIVYLGRDSAGHWWAEKTWCPNSACNRVVISVIHSDGAQDIAKSQQSTARMPLGSEDAIQVNPRGVNRPPVPPQVPGDFTGDYLEACLVLADSPKASAALSRRCLQHLLREKAKVKHPNDLAKAIEEVIDDPTVPSDMSAYLRATRNIGNLSVHPKPEPEIWRDNRSGAGGGRVVP